MDVPSRMAGLVQWLRKALPDETADLLEVLAKLHHEFVLIHPFDDGNGRVARLLVNYVLLRKDGLPIIIKSSDKQNYLAALQKADVGDLTALEDYLGKALAWSFTMGKCYSEPILSDEADQVINDELKRLFAQVKQLAGVK